MWILREGRNVLLLSVCQALFWSALMIGIVMSGLVGQQLVENKALATVPAGFMSLATILVTRPASRFMHRFGRRVGFLLGAMSGIAGGSIAAAGIFYADFATFCVGSAVLGIYQAIGQYFRLAATDGIDSGRHGRAVSIVMMGGIVAALVSPELSIWSKDLFEPVLFAGSFIMVGLLSALSVAMIVALQEPGSAADRTPEGGRPLSEIVRQPVFIAAIANAGVAHGVMILVMIATPLAMVACNFPDADAALVIRWHVLGMFVPSFFSGRLVDRFGAPTIGVAGAVVLAGSAGTAVAGIDYANFAIALALLGVGWNFMYVAGTTLIAASHRPEERGRVQGFAEMLIAGIAALSSFAAAALLHGFGWTAVNLGAGPMLLIAIVLTVWFRTRASKAPSLV